MTRPKNPNETTLLIKLPPDLKGSFQGLCKARGVSVSEELRRFMADQIASAAIGMTTGDRKLIGKKTNVINSVKCDKTDDLFAPPATAKQKLSIDAFNAVQAAKGSNDGQKSLESLPELSNAVKSAMNATKSRKKTKNRKK